MRWPWQPPRHRCELPDVPPSWETSPSVGRVQCKECGKVWHLVWMEDLVEYTIATWADIGEWVWVEAK